MCLRLPPGRARAARGPCRDHATAQGGDKREPGVRWGWKPVCSEAKTGGSGPAASRARSTSGWSDPPLVRVIDRAGPSAAAVLQKTRADAPVRPGATAPLWRPARRDRPPILPPRPSDPGGDARPRRAQHGSGHSRSWLAPSRGPDGPPSIQALRRRSPARSGEESPEVRRPGADAAGRHDRASGWASAAVRPGPPGGRRSHPHPPRRPDRLIRPSIAAHGLLFRHACGGPSRLWPGHSIRA